MDHIRRDRVKIFRFFFISVLSISHSSGSYESTGTKIFKKFDQKFDQKVGQKVGQKIRSKNSIKKFDQNIDQKVSLRISFI